MSNKPNRHYCFTLNNPQTELETFLQSDDLIRYAIWQREVGEAGTPHVQGYLELTRPTRWGALPKRYPNLQGAHFESRKGSRDQAREYCRKSETHCEGPWETGTFESSQGARSDLQAVSDALKRGADLFEIASEHTTCFIKYHRGIESTRLLLHPISHRDPDTPVQVHFFIGPPGCGKTSGIRNLADPDAYWKDNGKWWDGYTGQSDVIIDDMSGSSMSYQTFKRTCDRYPYTVEKKGSTTPLCATRFFLSSCSLPDKWWNPEQVREYRFDEISRRITHVHAWCDQTGSFQEFATMPGTSGYALDHYLLSDIHNKP